MDLQSGHGKPLDLDDFECLLCHIIVTSQAEESTGMFRSTATSSLLANSCYDLPEWIHCAVTKLELAMDLNLPKGAFTRSNLTDFKIGSCEHL